MKTIKKVIFDKHYYSTSKWGQNIETYVTVTRYFDFKEGLRYAVTTPNHSCCKRKKFDALMWAMEHESMKGMKYEGLKEQMYKHKLWNSIC